MSSGVPSNFDRKLRTAISSHSHHRSRSLGKERLGMQTHEPIRRQSRSRNSLNLSSKNITGEREVITNITVKKSTGGVKNRISTDHPAPRSKSPIASRKQSVNTSKVVSKRSGAAPLLPTSGRNKAKKKTNERKSSKSASRIVSRSKSKGKKLPKVQTDRLLIDQGLIS